MASRLGYAPVSSIPQQDTTRPWTILHGDRTDSPMAVITVKAMAADPDAPVTRRAFQAEVSFPKKCVASGGMDVKCNTTMGGVSKASP